MHYRVNVMISAMMAILMMIEWGETFWEYKYFRKRGVGGYHTQFKVMLGMILLNIFMLEIDIAFWFLAKDGNVTDVLIRRICLVLFAWKGILYHTILVLFMYYILLILSRKVKVSYYPLYAEAVVVLTDLVVWIVLGSRRIYRAIGLAGFSRNSIYPSYRILEITALFLVASVLLWYQKDMGRGNTIRLFLPLIVPVVTEAFSRRVLDYSLLSVIISLMLMMYHSFFNGAQSRMILEQEARLNDTRIELMLSQIRPHFLFNSLNSIYVLCEEDPREAQRAVGEFAEYLRMNLDGLNTGKQLFPFHKEMEYVNHYLALEKIRFRDALRVDLEIETEDFMLPLFTVQPIVENSVKHGLLHKKNGGTIEIRTKEWAKFYEIVVADDGVGFDLSSLTAAQEQDDAGANRQARHVGLANVRERLQTMCGGKLEIDSTPGIGTTVWIRIPK